MKRILAWLLLAAVTISFCACAKQETDGGAVDNSGKLMVGFAKVDITPEDNVPMAIYGNETERTSEGFMDYIYGYAMAVTGTNGETVLFMTVDHSWFHVDIANQVREKLGKEFSIPDENFILSGTHNHSAPSISTKTKEASRYKEDFAKKVLELGRAAMADQKPATMYTGSAKAEGMNFVRRYKLKDGTYPNFQKVSSDQIECHESEPDDELQVLKFVREDGKDIAVFNWQAHVNMVMQDAATYHLITSDILGNFRAEVEKKLDVECFVWNGAAGNLNPESQIDGEQPTDDHREYGKLLSAYGVEAYNNATEAEGGKVQVVTKTYVGEVNHTFDSVVGIAEEFVRRSKETGSSEFVREEGKTYGINTVQHATRIITNSKLGPTEEVPLKALCIGNVGFVCVYYEMFDTNGMQIKEQSPFSRTFIVGYTESGKGYIPSALVEDHGGYEVDNNVFMNGTGETLVTEYLDLLEQLKK